jgi:hypothetical protein
MRVPQSSAEFNGDRIALARYMKTSKDFFQAGRLLSWICRHTQKMQTLRQLTGKLPQCRSKDRLEVETSTKLQRARTLCR